MFDSLMPTGDRDILIPRRLHSTAKSHAPIGKTAGITIDEGMLERRRERKKAIPQQPDSGSINELPGHYIDRAIAANLPAFNEIMWTLGDVARWVVERTPQAV